MFCDVCDFDVGGIFDWVYVEDEFVRVRVVFVVEEYRVVIF